MKHLELNALNSSRNSSDRSKKLDDPLYLRRKMIHQQQEKEERRMIDIVKAHLLKSSVKNGKWKSYGPQYSLDMDGLGTSLISEMLLIRKRLLLTGVYRLVFKYHLPNELVHKAMCELTVEQNMQNQLEECLRDPLAMIIYAMYEHSRTQEMLLRPESLITKIKNAKDFSGIDFLTKHESL